MRILFSSTAGAGHFNPMVPLAHACVAAGHEVAVAAPASFAGAVERAGLSHRPFADVPEHELGAVFARLPTLPREEANAVVIREVFGGLDARAAIPGLDEILRSWRPDVIVRDPAELGSHVVAERHGVPAVNVALGTSAMEAYVLTLLDEPMRALGATRGVEGLAAEPVVSLVPAVFDTPRPGDGAIVRVRYVPPPAAAVEALPEWGDPDAPLVYVSYGSVTATIGPFGRVYPETVAALADRPFRVLFTTGDGLAPDDLGPVPANLRVERFRPQQTVMPVAAVSVGHGGFGTTMTALCHAVPQVVLPLFSSDQFLNADAVAAAGAGVTVPGSLDGVGVLADAVTQVLEDGAFVGGARRVADAIEALPPVDTAVEMLKRVADGDDAVPGSA